MGTGHQSEADGDRPPVRPPADGDRPPVRPPVNADPPAPRRMERADGGGWGQATSQATSQGTGDGAPVEGRGERYGNFGWKSSTGGTKGAERSVYGQSILIGKVGASDFSAKTGGLDGLRAGSALMHRGIRWAYEAGWKRNGWSRDRGETKVPERHQARPGGPTLHRAGAVGSSFAEEAAVGLEHSLEKRAAADGDAVGHIADAAVQDFTKGQLSALVNGVSPYM